MAGGKHGAAQRIQGRALHGEPAHVGRERRCSRRRNTIHTITEVDVTEPRRLIRENAERTGERLSFTAYVVTCFARAIAENPYLNSMRKGRRLILLDNVTISVLVERTIGGEQIPKPFGIPAADKKSYRQVHAEIRAAQRESQTGLGGLSGATWVRFLPRLSLSDVHHGRRAQRLHGTTLWSRGRDSCGHVSEGPLWLVPLSAAR